MKSEKDISHFESKEVNSERTIPQSALRNPQSSVDPFDVLILDDDLFSREVYSEILRKAGYRVSAFETVAEAIEAFRGNPTGVVLLDLFLGDENGIKILPQFLEISPDTSVLIITAHASLDTAVEAIHSGAYDYVVKPIQPEDLVNAVRRGREKHDLRAENRRLVGELIGQVRQLELIGRISTTITSTLELEPLLNLVMEHTQSLLQAEASSLMILDESGRELRIAVALGPKAEKLEHQTIKLGQGIAGWVAAEKRPLLVPDTSRDPRFDQNFDRDSGFQTRSLLAAPLLVRGKVVGVIEVINRKDGRAFSESDLGLLLSFGPHIAVAIENARITDDLKKSHEKLESRVNERTRELSQALGDVEKSNVQLKHAQAQLIQSEKLAGLGQLAAGVAHEINNPIGYIQSNLNSLQEYFQDLLGLISRQTEFQSAWKRNDRVRLTELARELDELGRKTNLDGLVSDLGRLVDETRQGTERVSKIVKNLKAFARADSGKPEPVNLNERLEETLTVINNELKYKAEVVREFGDIPSVMGMPGELNQVFLNLLVNAAQAIPKRGEIRIRTFAQDGHVGVEIKDNGAGIPEENLPRIFDPFFTTKAPGKGTGLGLSVAYGIVEKHKGRIEVDSKVGQGTRFTVFLPVEG